MADTREQLREQILVLVNDPRARVLEVTVYMEIVDKNDNINAHTERLRYDEYDK